MINVADFGALGDGVADDSAPIQDALDAGAGGWVHVPPGTYRLATLPLRIHGGTRLTLAQRARMLRAAPEGILRNKFAGDDNPAYSGHGDLIIEGGVWDMAGATGPYASAITLVHAGNIAIRDLAVLNTPGHHGIELNSVRTVRVRDCTFAGFRHDGDRAFSEAIQIDGAFSSVSADCAPYDGTVCDDVIVAGCWFGGSGATGTQPWPRGVGSHYMAADDLPGNEHRNINVIGKNNFQGVTDAAVWAWRWKQATIAGNTVEDSAKNGLVVKDGSYYVTVSDNHIYDSGYSGVWVNGGCSQVLVHDNLIVGSSAAQHNEHFGIRVSGSCDSVDVVDNRVRKRSTGNHSEFGLSIANGTGMLHHGNDLRGSGASGARQDLSVTPVIAATDAL